MPPPCNGGAANVGYYKVVGVEHFPSAYVAGDGPMKVVECRDKCTKITSVWGSSTRSLQSACWLLNWELWLRSPTLLMLATSRCHPSRFGLD
ncbi:curculin-like (mannose-binding) lectin family protein [Actinidia rufa]|uniref:Curculin-like (Mannose-binding) lectin family protein n=1 Tax=Actinidia rufa TaxID=165716 RepID=A0A7J0G8Q7_9ERIC|nr:curculin-like (mannose-binding) lectin family protein [Actinidia rufa]